MPDNSTEIHAALDRLARRLGRPTALINANFFHLGHSANSMDVDAVRTASVLNRRAPQPAIDWLRSFHIERASKAVWTPANQDLGLVSRVIVPIRRHSILIGFLSTQDEPTPLTEGDLAEMYTCAAIVAEHITLMAADRRDVAERNEDTLKLLLRGGPEEVELGASRLRELSFDLGRRARVIHCTTPGSTADRKTDLAFSIRDELGARTDRQSNIVGILHPNLPEVTILSNETDEALTRTLTEISRTLEVRTGSAAKLGVSSAAPSALTCVSALYEAMLTAYLTEHQGLVTSIVWWDNLGAYRLLTQLGPGPAPSPFGGTPASPELKALDQLAADRSGVSLIDSLEGYLEAGGDVQKAARALFIHRATLYQRLARVRDITRLDPQDGDARLQLHLELRLRRLAEAMTRMRASLIASDGGVPTTNGENSVS